jgi:hypothetical protein
MRALLISTYDLGHQPFGLASPAAWLKRDGAKVRCADLAKDRLADEWVREADLVAFHLPMHTATRLAGPVIGRVRALNPGARLCAYGLYAPLNETWLRSLGVTDVFGAEFEADLAAIARAMGATVPSPRSPARDDVGGGDCCIGSDRLALAHPTPGTGVGRAGAADGDRRGTGADQSAGRRTRINRLEFLVPDRAGLPPLARYATLHVGDGRPRIAGYTEASRGCRHLCRHCPVVPVYEGQFRVVQPDVVLADIASQIAAGAEHITFGDPDFFNGPTHAMRTVEAFHGAYPSTSYDVTIKVEHLLKHRHLLPRLAATGCLFVTSAVESLDDRVLGLLAKGHTRGDFLDVVALCRASSVTLVPTFVAFHPWLTLEGYCDLLDTIEALGLVEHVAPIQLAIRLLIPAGSRLLELEDVRSLVGPFDGRTLTYPWAHADSRVDELHAQVSAIVGGRVTSDRRTTFDAISVLAHRAAGLPRPSPRDRPDAGSVPYLDEPWYCCAEPSPEQLTLV